MSQAAQMIFSAEGANHTSEGDPKLMVYGQHYVNVGLRWNEQDTFRTILPGVYFFAISCVREASGGATADDVRIVLRKNGQPVGSAWCGAGSGTRSTGAYSVALPSTTR